MAQVVPTQKSPEEILPLLVWDMIFDMLDSPTDVANCFRTCSAWRELLKPKRTYFLMPEVYPVLHKYLVNEENETGLPGVNYPIGFIPVPSKSVLNTRQVCRSWKFGVDTFIEQVKHNSNIGLDPKSLVKLNGTLQPYLFDELLPHKIATFMSKGFHPESNPFVGRFLGYRVFFSFENGGMLKPILESYGAQIWYVELIYTYGNQFNEENVYNLFQYHLSRMPYLRTLRVNFQIVEGTRSYSYKKLLERNPLPKLEHLTTLVMDNVPPAIEKGLILANNHVKKLQVGYRAEGYPNSSLGIPVYLKMAEMANLEEFATNVYVKMDLKTLQSLSWPIRGLKIRYAKVKVDKIKRAVSQSCFGNNLKQLMIVPEED